MPSQRSESDLVALGTIVKDKWHVVRKIGGGGFGEIYEALDVQTHEKVALKTESNRQSKQVLKMEVAVLKKLQGYEHVCKFLGCGRHARFNFLAMNMKGKNLAELRRSLPSGVFTFPTTMRLLSQIIDSIQAVHSVGFLHRDIKPSNFAMGLHSEDPHTVYILDFGLARMYINSEGQVRPPRRTAGFRGTVRYASISAHQGRELSRADDFWSTIYMAVEFVTGQLPWRRIKDKEQVGKMKLRTDHLVLINTLPAEFREFLQHIQGLSYYDAPDYGFLKSIIQRIIRKNKFVETGPYDWDVDEAVSRDASLQTRAIMTREQLSQRGGNYIDTRINQTSPKIDIIYREKLDIIKRKRTTSLQRVAGPSNVNAQASGSRVTHAIIGEENADMSNNLQNTKAVLTAYWADSSDDNQSHEDERQSDQNLRKGNNSNCMEFLNHKHPNPLHFSNKTKNMVYPAPSTNHHRVHASAEVSVSDVYLHE